MGSLLKALFGGFDDVFAVERLKIKREKEGLDAKIAEELHMAIRHVFPGRDPEDVILEQPKAAKAVFERIKTYYLDNIRERLELLDRLEDM